MFSDEIPEDINEGHSKNKYPWNTRGPVRVIPVRPVGTDTDTRSHGYHRLIRFDSEFMCNENFRKLNSCENLRGSG